MALSQLGSGHAFDLGDAEGVEAAHQRHVDMDLGCLAFGGPRGDPLADGLEVPHPDLDSAADMVAGPPFPDRPTEWPGCPRDVVAG